MALLARGSKLFYLAAAFGLAAFGVKREHLDALAEGSKGNSLNGNPRAVSTEELRRLLETAL